MTGSDRSAEKFQPPGRSPVHNIVTYRFGSDPQSTRPDRILRSPTAAILIQTRGRLYAWHEPGRRTALPEFALLGPSNRSHIWATDPDTEFTLVNLGPGITRRLFATDPRDIEDAVDGLKGHILGDRLRESLAHGQAALHRCLCALALAGGPETDDEWRAAVAFSALLHRAGGERVREYADRFGVTTRTLQRTVRAGVGLTPKRVLGIERLRSLVTLTAGGWAGTLAELAQAGGFYDQSHLNREVQRYDFSHPVELAAGDHIVIEDPS